MPPQRLNAIQTGPDARWSPAAGTDDASRPPQQLPTLPARPAEQRPEAQAALLPRGSPWRRPADCRPARGARPRLAAQPPKVRDAGALPCGPERRLPSLAQLDGAHSDVLVIQSEKKSFTSPYVFLNETKKQVIEKGGSEFTLKSLGLDSNNGGLLR